MTINIPLCNNLWTKVFRRTLRGRAADSWDYHKIKPAYFHTVYIISSLNYGSLHSTQVTITGSNSMCMSMFLMVTQDTHVLCFPFLKIYSCLLNLYWNNYFVSLPIYIGNAWTLTRIYIAMSCIFLGVASCFTRALSCPGQQQGGTRCINYNYIPYWIHFTSAIYHYIYITLLVSL